jgi:hypothetical protein
MPEDQFVAATLELAGVAPETDGEEAGAPQPDL